MAVKKIWIDQLCRDLDGLAGGLEPENTSGLTPSPDRIRARVLERIARQETAQTGGEKTLPPPGKEKPMKKHTFRIILAAAVVCLFSVTALALGGADLFRAVFGEGAGSLQEQIETPSASAEDQAHRLSVLASLSDGYKTNLILSLESLAGDGSQKEAQDRLGAMVETQAASITCTPLEEFDRGRISCYRLEVSTLENHQGKTITVTLDGDTPLLLEVTPEKRLASLTVEIPAEAFPGENYRPEEVQLSPLGVLVIGTEAEISGPIPNVEILAVMEDGSKEEIMPLWAFDGAADASLGGGGAATAGPGEEEPLVVHTTGARNLDGKTVTTANFTRVLSLDQVAALEISGQRFPVSR